MVIAIKGMVCRHCVEAVESILDKLGIPTDMRSVELGEVSIHPSLISPQFLAALDRELPPRGFSRILNPADKLVENAKRVIIEHVRNHDCRFNLSACLQENLHTDYTYLSKIFSAREGRTIEKYAIAQRVEFAKELLGYGETISEVAFHAGYSSAAHLSRQFKAQTGLTPSEYQRLRHLRIPLNEV